ncbi:MAG: hypothetical protein OXC62_04945 [Aestuariivita sp.]|nr:hypothetical protein [Aestuariivita sp.]
MAYIVAIILVACFTANVTLGAISETGTAPLGIVAEMVILFGASIFFSIGILQSEAHAKSTTTKDKINIRRKL